jgi:putative intracellular protease/amidase
MTARVWIPLPDTDFEPTEAAAPWRVLTDAGHQVVFATEAGATPSADQKLLRFKGLLSKFGASRAAKDVYAELERAPEFRVTMPWSEIEPEEYDALVLPGGHAPGMRQYLESNALRDKVIEFWKLGRPVGAICHGVLVLARAIDPATQHSLLWDRRTTALPKLLERTAYVMTFWKLGRYYRTYDTYVEDEVKAALASPAQFDTGPLVLTTPDRASAASKGFAIEDRNYVSARWPGDAWTFARKLLELVEARQASAVHSRAQPSR